MCAAHMQRGDGSSASPGIAIHAPGFYDLTVWFATRGRERTLRQKFLDLARLQAGEAVLDIGCGTGTLAVAAKRRAGPAAQVCGVDVSPEMLARARKKAKKAHVQVDFREGTAQDLPFADGRFDLVLCTVTLHHVPADARSGAIHGAARVLKPGGRVFVADFETPSKPARGLHRHGGVKFEDISALLAEAGLTMVDSGPVGLRDLQFALAVRA